MLLGIFLFFITILLLLILLSMIWPPDSPWSPWWRTDRKTARGIVSLAKISSKDIVYDLGCGDGSLLLESARKGARGFGIEIDIARVLFAKLRLMVAGMGGKVVIKRGNLFDEDVSEASIVAMYLVPKTLARLEKKLKKELKPKSRVVTYMYPLPYFKKIAENSDGNIFLYEV
jgi:cyclopropane fatty-acyl-phospholipid synthase-like methyltransferase